MSLILRVGHSQTFVGQSNDNLVASQAVISESNVVRELKARRGARTGDLKDGAVAKVIEFYIPANFSKRVKWLSQQQRGRVIEFRLPTRKSAGFSETTGRLAVTLDGEADFCFTQKAAKQSGLHSEYPSPSSSSSSSLSSFSSSSSSSSSGTFTKQVVSHPEINGNCWIHSAHAQWYAQFMPRYSILVVDRTGTVLNLYRGAILDAMDHLAALREKIGVLRAEIAHLQELDNDYYRRHGRNWMSQVEHDQRLERLQAIQHELTRLADLGRRVHSVEQMKEQHRARPFLIKKAS